jgi:hypothetical protein
MMACLVQRHDPPNNVWRSGRLAHQFIIDAHVRVEDLTLQYIERNVQEFLVMPYADLQGAIDVEARLHNVAPGKTILMPASVQNSQRCMEGRLRDAMHCIHQEGNPDLLFTMTCNPGWREIKENRAKFPDYETQLVDITSRLLHLKIRILRDMLFKYYAYGVSDGTRPGG